jgi:capsular polysaccharide transport system permease protein
MRSTEVTPRPVFFARSRAWLSSRAVPPVLRGWLPEPSRTGQRLPALWQASIRLSWRTLAAPGGGGRYRRIVLVFLPTMLSILYFGLIATDRYVSEAQFTIRTASKPHGLTGVGSFLQMAGITHDQDDAYSVQEFMTSRDAVQQLEARLPMLQIYGRPEADFIARYPSIFYGKSLEQFHSYLQWMISVIYTSATGVSTIRVEAFRPEDAQAIAGALLDLGEDVVNRMNDRIENDAVRVAADEVGRDQQRLIDDQVEITDFRNKEMMIDVNKSSVIVTELIAKLDDDLSQTKAEVTQLTASSPGSPQLGVLQAHVDAVAAQILKERSQISDKSTGLAEKLANYERLMMESEFARHELESASGRLDSARVEAQRQQLYLERVVEPNRADYSMAPERWRMIATTFGLNLLGLLVVWLVINGVAEHAAANS